MAKLSWDLHLHPGPSLVPRWGDGKKVWEAARAAGIHGFVWKSHEEHTVERCKALPSGPPHAIPSVSLNSWTTIEQVVAALDAGARWIWGPSRDSQDRLAWELELPAWWPELRDHLAMSPRSVALATSHLGSAGRLAFAEASADIAVASCTITHSLYLPAAEMDELTALGSAFEFDLYTYMHAIEGRPSADLVERCGRLLNRGALVYLTSDAGQLAVGNPFDFSASVLAELLPRAGTQLIDELATTGPAAMVRRVLPAEMAA